MKSWNRWFVVVGVICLCAVFILIRHAHGEDGVVQQAPPAAEQSANNAPASQDISELSTQSNVLLESCKKITRAMQTDRERREERANQCRSSVCDVLHCSERLEKEYVAYKVCYAFWRECVGDVSTGDRAKLDAFAVALDNAAGKFTESIEKNKLLLLYRFDNAIAWMRDPTSDAFYGWDENFEDIPSFPEGNFEELQGIDAVALRHFQAFRQELLEAQTLYIAKASEVLRFVNQELQQAIATFPLPAQEGAVKEEETSPK